MIGDCSTTSLCCLCAGDTLQDRRPSGCVAGACHHFLPHLPDFQLETDLGKRYQNNDSKFRSRTTHLAREDLAVLGLELCGGCVGGEESLLLEQLHHQLPPAVQSLSERQPRCAGGLGRARQVALVSRHQHLGVEVRPEESVAGQFRG